MSMAMRLAPVMFKLNTSSSHQGQHVWPLMKDVYSNTIEYPKEYVQVQLGLSMCGD